MLAMLRLQQARIRLGAHLELARACPRGFGGHFDTDSLPTWLQIWFLP